MANQRNRKGGHSSDVGLENPRKRLASDAFDLDNSQSGPKRTKSDKSLSRPDNLVPATRAGASRQQTSNVRQLGGQYVIDRLQNGIRRAHKQQQQQNQTRNSSKPNSTATELSTATAQREHVQQSHISHKTTVLHERTEKVADNTAHAKTFPFTAAMDQKTIQQYTQDHKSEQRQNGANPLPSTSPAVAKVLKAPNNFVQTAIQDTFIVLSNDAEFSSEDSRMANRKQQPQNPRKRPFPQDQKETTKRSRTDAENPLISSCALQAQEGDDNKSSKTAKTRYNTIKARSRPELIRAKAQERIKILKENEEQQKLKEEFQIRLEAGLKSLQNSHHDMELRKQQNLQERAIIQRPSVCRLKGSNNVVPCGDACVPLLLSKEFDHSENSERPKKSSWADCAYVIQLLQDHIRCRFDKPGQQINLFCINLDKESQARFPHRVLNGQDLYVFRKNIYVATRDGLVPHNDYLVMNNITHPVTFNGSIPPWIKVAFDAVESGKMRGFVHKEFRTILRDESNLSLSILMDIYFVEEGPDSQRPEGLWALGLPSRGYYRPPHVIRKYISWQKETARLECELRNIAMQNQAEGKPTEPDLLELIKDMDTSEGFDPRSLEYFEEKVGWFPFDHIQPQRPEVYPPQADRDGQLVSSIQPYESSESSTLHEQNHPSKDIESLSVESHEDNMQEKSYDHSFQEQSFEQDANMKQPMTSSLSSVTHAPSPNEQKTFEKISTPYVKTTYESMAMTTEHNLLSKDAASTVFELVSQVSVKDCSATDLYFMPSRYDPEDEVDWDDRAL